MTQFISKKNYYLLVFLFFLTLVQKSTQKEQQDTYTYSIYPKKSIKLQNSSSTVLVDSIQENILSFTQQGEVISLKQEENNAEFIINKSIQICSTIKDAKLSQNSENIVYIACTQEGLKVFDINQFKIIQEFGEQPSFLIKTIFSQEENQKNVLYSSYEGGISKYQIDQNEQLSNQIIYENTEYQEIQDFQVTSDGRFLFAAKYVLGFFIYDISDISSPVFVLFDIFQFGYGVKNVIIHPLQNICFIQTEWDRIEAYDFNQLYEINDKNYSSIIYVPTGVFVDTTYSLKIDLHISGDGKYLYSPQVGQGVVLIDVSDLQNMFVQQILEQFGTLQKISLQPQKNEFLVMTQSKSVYLYERSYPEQPQINMFTRAQSTTWKNPGTEVWPWTTMFTRNNDIMYLACGYDGLYVFETKHLPEITLEHVYKDPQIPGLAVVYTVAQNVQNEDIIYVGCYQELALFIMDFTDVANPILLSTLIIEGQTSIQFIQPFKQFEDLILVNLQAYVAIINVSDLSNPRVQSTLVDSEFVLASQGERFNYLSNQETHVFGISTVSNLVYVAEIKENNTVIEIQNTAKVEYPYQPIQSKIDEQIIYVLGSTGIFYIFNLIDYQEFEKIAELIVVGTMYQMTHTNDENYMFLTSALKNELLTVEMSDKYNPQVLHIFQAPAEFAFYSILVNVPQQGGQYLLINTFPGMRIIPIFSKAQLNVEFYKVLKIEDKTILQPYSKQEDQSFIEFNVGEVCQIVVNNLVNPVLKNIQQFYYYNVNQPKLLTQYSEYFEFDMQNKIINFTASKDLLGFNTIVVKVHFITSSDDILQEIQKNQDLVNLQPDKTDAEISEYMYEKAIKFGYIDAGGFPTNKFDQDETIIMLIDDKYEIYLDIIHKILSDKIQLVPIYFKIKESLFFNPELTQSTEKDKIIQTYTDQIDITFSVNKEKASFFDQKFQGLLVSYSGEYDYITITGKVNIINNIINTVKLAIYNSSQIEDLLVNVSIDDGLNNSFYEQYKFQELKFLKVNESVQLSNKVQDQFNSQFDEGKLFVQEQFQFQFSQNTFVDDDILNFQIFIKNDYDEETLFSEEYTEITQQTNFLGCWFSFESQQRTLKGECSLQMINSKFRFKVLANDGFTEAEDELELFFYKLPALVIIYYTALGFSGLITVLGMIKYRGTFYGILCKSKYKSGSYYIKDGQKFLIQLILNKEDLDQAMNIFSQIKQYLKKENSSLYTLFKDENTFLIDQKKVQKLIEFNVQNYDPQAYEKEESFQYITFKSLIYNEILKQKKFSKERKIIQQLKQYSIKQVKTHPEQWYEQYVVINPIDANDEYCFTPYVEYRLDIILQAFKALKLFRNVNLDQIIQNLNIYGQKENLSKILGPVQKLIPNVNLFIILKTIKMSALGVIQQEKYKFTQGQCITASKQSIKIIKALKKRESKINKCLKLINWDYISIPFSQNAPLPPWCKYRFQSNVLEIYGVYPQKLQKSSQNNNIIIRIEDYSGRTLKEFHIKRIAQSDSSDNGSYKKILSSTNLFKNSCFNASNYPELREQENVNEYTTERVSVIHDFDSFNLKIPAKNSFNQKGKKNENIARLYQKNNSVPNSTDFEYQNQGTSFNSKQNEKNMSNIGKHYTQENQIQNGINAEQSIIENSKQQILNHDKHQLEEISDQNLEDQQQPVSKSLQFIENDISKEFDIQQEQVGQKFVNYSQRTNHKNQFI